MRPILVFVFLLSVTAGAKAEESLSRKTFSGVHVDIKEVFALPHSHLSRLFLNVKAPPGGTVWVDPTIEVYPSNGQYSTDKIRDIAVTTPRNELLQPEQAFGTALVAATVPNDPVSLRLWLIDKDGNKKEILVHLDMPELTKIQTNQVISRYRGVSFEMLGGSSLDSISGQEQNSGKGFTAENRTFTGGLPQYQFRIRYGFRPLYYLLAEYFGRVNGNVVNTAAPDQRTQSDITAGLGFNLPPRDSVVFGVPYRTVRQLYVALDQENLPLLNYSTSSASDLVDLHNLYLRLGAEFTFDSEKRWFLRTHYQFGYMVTSNGFKPNFAFLLGGRFMYGYMLTNEWYGGAEIGAIYRELDGTYSGSTVSYSYLSGTGLLVLGYHPLGVKTRR